MLGLVGQLVAGIFYAGLSAVLGTGMVIDKTIKKLKRKKD